MHRTTRPHHNNCVISAKVETCWPGSSRVAFDSGSCHSLGHAVSPRCACPLCSQECHTSSAPLPFFHLRNNPSQLWRLPFGLRISFGFTSGGWVSCARKRERTALAVILWEPSTLSFETRSLTRVRWSPLG